MSTTLTTESKEEIYPNDSISLVGLGTILSPAWHLSGSDAISAELEGDQSCAFSKQINNLAYDRILICICLE